MVVRLTPEAFLRRRRAAQQHARATYRSMVRNYRLLLSNEVKLAEMSAQIDHLKALVDAQEA